MSETVQQIKEQVMNLARRPTTSAPDDTDNESDEDDYVEPTPYFRSLDIYELFMGYNCVCLIGLNSVELNFAGGQQKL
ncbi:hypothetical protein MTR67_051820, partial [Solanum verrucosum]